MATIVHPKSKLKSQGWYQATNFLSVFMVYLALLFFVVLAVYPMLTMLMNSFKSDNEMYRNPVALPITWTLESYAQIFAFHGGMWLNFINSAIIAVTQHPVFGHPMRAGSLCLCQVSL